MLGTYYDDKFEFMRITLVRCHNGTNDDGRAIPGPCRPPAEIDELVWKGSLTLALAEEDLDITRTESYTQIRAIKSHFVSSVNATQDVMFTVRFVTIQPRAFFDKFDENAQREFVIVDHVDTSYTDFRSERVGKWNQPDPSFVPQYAAYFLMLTDEKLDQQRRTISTFTLLESWGASIVFFYMIFSLLASRFNRAMFKKQVKGLDLRDLTKDQFDQFGRLVDRSFQVPRELQDGSI